MTVYVEESHIDVRVRRVACGGIRKELGRLSMEWGEAAAADAHLREWGEACRARGNSERQALHSEHPGGLLERVWGERREGE